MSQSILLPPVTISTSEYGRLAWIANAGKMSRRAPPAAEMLVDELVRATVVTELLSPGIRLEILATAVCSPD